MEHIAGAKNDDRHRRSSVIVHWIGSAGRSMWRSTMVDRKQCCYWLPSPDCRNHRSLERTCRVETIGPRDLGYWRKIQINEWLMDVVPVLGLNKLGMLQHITASCISDKAILPCGRSQSVRQGEEVPTMIRTPNSAVGQQVSHDEINSTRNS